MTVLTVILIALFLTIMVLVSKIQGTARVVNYAGLVRGKTQRIIKLEDAKEPQDEMIESVASFIEGLRYGSDELNLVRLDDHAFQNKMKELDEHFQKLQKEIRQVRKEGYENTEIIEKSEVFFVICDEATGLAEKYAQKKATALERLEKIVIADIIGLVRTAPKSDIIVLFTTFLLTILFDLVVAIEIGMVLACLLFIKRMSEETHVDSWVYVDDDTPDVDEQLKELPLQIRVYEITGPLFFGAADAIEHIVVKDFTRCLVLRMRSVPAIDSTAMNALFNLTKVCENKAAF